MLWIACIESSRNTVSRETMLGAAAAYEALFAAEDGYIPASFQVSGVKSP